MDGFQAWADGEVLFTVDPRWSPEAEDGVPLVTFRASASDTCAFPTCTHSHPIRASQPLGSLSLGTPVSALVGSIRRVRGKRVSASAATLHGLAHLPATASFHLHA